MSHPVKSTTQKSPSLATGPVPSFKTMNFTPPAVVNTVGEGERIREETRIASKIHEQRRGSPTTHTCYYCMSLYATSYSGTEL